MIISLRTRIFILISAALLIILAISVFLMMPFGKEQPAVETIDTPAGSLPGAVLPDNMPVGTVPPSPVARQFSPEDMEKNAAKQLAKIFIERYGTYSSDNDSSNIEDVKNLAAPALWSKLSVKIGEGGSEGFTGMTTRVISAELSDWTGETARVNLQTVRVEEKNGATDNLHQNAEVNLMKKGSDWLVESFRWL